MQCWRFLFESLVKYDVDHYRSSDNWGNHIQWNVTITVWNLTDQIAEKG
jgi:hypothetical protein